MVPPHTGTAISAGNYVIPSLARPSITESRLHFERVAFVEQSNKQIFKASPASSLQWRKTIVGASSAKKATHGWVMERNWRDGDTMKLLVVVTEKDRPSTRDNLIFTLSEKCSPKRMNHKESRSGSRHRSCAYASS